ncbi:MAG TPA: dihydrolipoamide acetyltransferase family protein [Propionibacteriaceae bacterium]|nr:dihydrolipoamide acetyltransferase family protein [Propionibacteriaceae bacterium]
MTIREFRLPDPGEGLVEADIVTWRVAVGDQVEINDIVVEIETSKSLVELPSPYAGVVTGLLVAEGSTVDVGSPIIAIDDGVGAAPAPATEDMVPELPVPEPEGGTASPGGRVSVLVGYGPKTTEAKRRPRKSAPADPASEQAHAMLAASTFATDAPVSRRTDKREALQPGPDGADAPPPAPPLPGPGPAAPQPTVTGASVLAKPPVRKLAKDLGIKLSDVLGSGPGGVITRDDVLAEAEAGWNQEDLPAEPVEAPAALRQAEGETQGAETRIPIKGVRKATAQAMVQSAFTAPHVSAWLTCDVSATMALVERLKSRREFAEVRISPLLIIAKAVCLALSRTPELNSSWDEAAQEIVVKHAINLGIAAATPRGLVVPNVKDAGSRDLVDLAATLNELVSTARQGKTQPADMSGGTFTITNIGVFGVDAGTPILNPGEAGILCVGQIARRPWVVGEGAEERIEPRWVTTLAVSFDHRLADGAQGSTFLAAVGAILADPGLALLY